MQLQPHEAEQQRVEEEAEDRPKAFALKTRIDGRQLRRVPAHVDAGRNHREHARGADRGRRQVCDIAREERDHDLERRIVQASADLSEHVSDRKADGDPSHDSPDEARRRVHERERTGDDGGDGELEEDERRAVVDQALALDHRQRPARDAEPPADRCRRDRVGRRHDRSEHERSRPRQADHRVHDSRDRHSCCCNQPEREERDRPKIPAQLSQSGVVRGQVEERRQDPDEDDVRRHDQSRYTRGEAEPEPAEDEQDRVRNPQRLGEEQQHRRADEHQQELQLLVRAEGGQRSSHARMRAQSGGGAVRFSAASRRACCFTHARWRWLRVAYFGFQYTGTSLE